MKLRFPLQEEARLEAGGAEEETQSEGEEDEDVKVGETIHKVPNFPTVFKIS